MLPSVEKAKVPRDKGDTGVRGCGDDGAGLGGVGEASGGDRRPMLHWDEGEHETHAFRGGGIGGWERSILAATKPVWFGFFL